MTADILREAAAKMREQAEAATPGPWEFYEQHGRDYADEGWSEIGVKAAGHDVAHTYPIGFENDYPEPDAQHIASWHPAVALAVADWLDETAAGIMHRPKTWDAALAVARAYVGRDA